MAWMFVQGSCVACNAFISFNPNRVPSISVDGRREPLCELCHARWNKIHRTAKNLEPVPIHPDAYGPEEVA